MFTVLAALMVVAGVLLAVLALSTAKRRRAAAGRSLAVLLFSVAWWAFAYAVELSLSDVQDRQLWGDLKYAGAAAVAPAWLVFVLRYTNRGHLVSRRLVLGLSVEPVLVMAVLLTPATHDLVRYYPSSVAAGEVPVVGTGPLFWVHFAYVNAVLLVATVAFVASMVRTSRLYRRPAMILVAAALLPWTANLLHNFVVGPFARVDLTPFAFVVTGAVLFWGLFRQRLVNLAPVARHLIVETMADPVLVLDPFGRVVDANPAAGTTFGCRRRGDLIGRPVADLLPRHPALAPQRALVGRDGRVSDAMVLPVNGLLRHFDVRRQLLPVKGGGKAGQLLVLRDVTDRTNAETQLRHLLTERTRIAHALQVSLLPTALPSVPGVRMAARYHPAGEGLEVGGDFYDVFPVDARQWVVVLGDVSGKGTEAAVVTALIRYSIRALTVLHCGPRQVLAALNEALLRQSGPEQFCTVVYALVRPSPEGLDARICLGGHHQPLLVRSDGAVEAVGRHGTALGLFDDPDLYEVDVHLGAGDALCLFTDGLVEARQAKEHFGSERAADILRFVRGEPAGTVADALEQAARVFCSGDLADDLAIVFVQVADAGPEERRRAPDERRGARSGTRNAAG